MSVTEKVMGGQWVAEADVHPMTNIAGRRYWARGNIEGHYNGYWPTKDGMRPAELFWWFPSDAQQEAKLTEQYDWTEYSMGYTITELPSYRIPDPFWRRVLIRLGLARPRYRTWSMEEYHQKRLRKRMEAEKDIQRHLNRSIFND